METSNNLKTTAKYKLRKLVAKYTENRDKIIDPSSEYHEAEARNEYIDPFLELLGWDVQNSSNKPFMMRDVVVESYITRHSKPDYLLCRNGVSVLVVEAEKPSKDVHKDLQPSTQVLQYGWLASTNIGFLTNFETLQIFETTAEPGDTPNKPFFSCEYNEYLDNDKFDVIWKFLSNESAYNGNLDKYTAKVVPDNSSKLKLDTKFLDLLNTWRVLIAKDLINHDTKYKKNVDLLNKDIQIFLNQVIFLRMAEDNSLERENKLSDIDSSPDEFKKHLDFLDKKYNSGIFSNSNIADNLSLETIRNLSENLYYPQSIYNFAVIDLNILGHIYERFLQKQISVKNGEVSLVKTEQASIKSVVSTPTELTNLIVHEAIGKRISNINSIDEILKLHVLDMASGSGTFLVSAYDSLEGRIIEILSKQNRVAARPDLIPLNLKKKIIKNVLYGVDVDSHAALITKFSLALRLLRNESPDRFRGELPIVPSMDNHIRSFNSLISEDDLVETDLNDDLENCDLEVEVKRVNPGNWCNKKFDIIIGNPPYLKTADMKKQSLFEYLLYKQKYSVASKQFDKYYLFIEKGIQLLGTKGSMTLVVPNKFLVIQSAINLRKLLSNKKSVRSIIDFGATQLFDDKSTYVAIVTFSKESNENIEYSEVSTVADAMGAKFLKFSYDTLSENNGPWLLTNQSEVKELYLKMNDFPRLTDVLNISNGIQTSKNSVYIINVKNVISDSANTLVIKKDGKKYTLEKEIIKPFFKNTKKGLHAYTKLKNDSYVIFPYKGGKLIDELTMKSKFPGVYSYLLKFKKEILPRNLGGSRDVQPEPDANQWFAYGRSQALQGWNKDKLIISTMSNKPSVSFNNSGVLLASGGTAGYIPIYKGNNQKYTGYSLLFAQAWINYPKVDAMFKMLSTYFEGGFWTHGTTVMKQIPFLTINFNDGKQNELYDKVVKSTSQANNLSNVMAKRIIVKKINKYLDNLVDLIIKEKNAK